MDAILFDHSDMISYARANVAHATAAKDAEIEALRADVERLQGINSGLCRKSNYYLIDSARWQERAERLAEALKCLNSATRRYMEERPMSDAEWASDEPSVLSVVDAALDQEEGK